MNRLVPNGKLGGVRGGFISSYSIVRKRVRSSRLCTDAGRKQIYGNDKIYHIDTMCRMIQPQAVVFFMTMKDFLILSRQSLYIYLWIREFSLLHEILLFLY